ncbi:hypothetical protein E4T47_07924 [Aureobasidium subglaciale]|nr:hypothetical protein E4T47_07924 [Aureobasidium subglaciale]
MEHRRGTEAPRPKTSSIYEAMVNPTLKTNKPVSPSSPKKASWINKLRIPSREQEGTVLHAVPPRVATYSMSALDIAMAVSPNEEVLHAIGKRNSTSMSPSAATFSNRVTASGNHLYEVFDSRIGVWRDGVARWDNRKPQQNLRTSLHKPADTSRPRKLDKTLRPQLSVRIPGSKLRQVLGEEAPILPEPSKPARTPTTIISRRSVSPQSLNMNQRSIHPAFRTTDSLEESQGSEARSLSSRENSRSSVSSITVFHDEIFDVISCYSRNSSMTSLGAEPPDDVVQNSHWNYLDVPKRSASAAFSITDPVKAGIFDEMTEDGEATRTVFLSQYLQVPGRSNTEQLEDGASKHRSPTPTLSEAVHDLQMHLSTITERLSPTTAEDGVVFETSNHDLVLNSVSRAPTLPKKSRKREWLQTKRPDLAIAIPEAAEGLVRHQSVLSRNQLSKDQQGDVRRVSSVRCSALNDAESTWLSWDASTVKKSPALAFEQETVYHQILASALSFEDLKSLSMLTKNTRRYYEDNKLCLLKSVLFNMSPPAWELRELSPFPFGNFMTTDFFEHTEITPSAYMSCVNHDQRIMQELKAMLATKCQSFLRPETVSSLTTKGCMRVDDAIYRIWSFCKMFGCDRGREHDLRGQIDWLKGGVLAHQKGCAATLSFSPEIEMEGILLNAPDHFAAGNMSGLSAEQLYDMLEIWECLYSLMQHYEGETTKAQNCGIFRHTGGQFADPSAQDRVIEEWIAYILSLGPSVVLELARFQDACAGFGFAHLNEWTDWTPPQSGMTRRRFFREPVSQLYEERLLASTASVHIKDATKALLRKRQTAEINLAYRQMSLRNASQVQSSCPLSRHDSAVAPEVLKRPTSKRHSTPTSPRSPSTSTRGAERVQSPTWSPRKVSPIIEHRVDTFNRLSMLSFEGMTEDTSGMAIGKIMEIGFSNAQAKEALRVTDMGSGLRMDRAVDWLFRKNRF